MGWRLVGATRHRCVEEGPCEDQRPQQHPRNDHHHRRREAIANVVLHIGGQRLVASITTAFKDLRRPEVDPLIAAIKASDVMIAVAD
jgi:hypothetical protein